MNKNASKLVSSLRKERGILVARLVSARKMTDDLSAYRVGNLQRELSLVNDRLNKVLHPELFV